MTFTQWIESETLGELAGLLDDNGRVLLERVYSAGRDDALLDGDEKVQEARRETGVLALRLERVIEKATDQKLWCTPELHTHIMQAALGKDGAA